MLDKGRKRVRWYEGMVVVVMVACILAYANCICSAESAEEIVSRVLKSYSGLPTFKVRVENHYGKKKDKPDEIIEATFKGSKLVSTKVVKPKPSGISISVSPGLPVDILSKLKPAEIKRTGSEEKKGVTHYILEAEQAPVKTVITVNSANWTISRSEVYMEGEKLGTAEFKYAKIQGYFLPVEVQFTSTWGEKEEKSFGIYKDYRFDIELAETEVGIFERAERMKELKSMFPVVSLLEYDKYLIAVSSMGHVFIKDPESKTWFKLAESYSNIVKETKEGMKMTSGVPVAAAVVGNNFLWIGSNGGGLQQIDLRSGKATRYMRKEGLLTNNIGALAVQRNTLWIGCRYEVTKKGEKFIGGLICMDLNSNKTQRYSLTSLSSANGISGIDIDIIQGNIWVLCAQDRVKVFEDGSSTSYQNIYIARFDHLTNTFIPIKKTGDHSIINFFGGSGKALWYSGMSSIISYNIETGKTTEVCKWDYSWGQLKTGLLSKDKLWLLSGVKGLYVYMLSKGQLIKILDTETTAILKAKDGTCVVSSEGFNKPKQVIKIMEDNGKWKLFKEDGTVSRVKEMVVFEEKKRSIPSDIPADVKKQIERLQSSNPKERVDAGIELGKMGERAACAIPILIKMLGDGTTSLPGMFLDGRTYGGATVLGEEAKKALTEIGVPAVQPLIVALKNENNLVRQKAAQTLGKIGDKRAVEPLIEALKDKDGSVRYYAASAFTMIRDNRAVEPLIAVLKDEHVYGPNPAISALGEIGDARAAKSLVPLLKHKDMNIRQKVAQALGKIGNKESIGPLANCVNDENKIVRLAVARALAKFRDKKAAKALNAFLKDRDPYVRQAAVRGLGEIGDGEAIKPLSECVSDEDKNVGRAAVETLGTFRDKKAVKALVALLKYKDADIRWEAARALGKTRDKEAMEPLIECLKDENSKVRCIVAGVLGKFGDKKTVKSLIASLKDKEWGVRSAAVNALGEIGDKEAIEPLTDCLKDEDKRVRYWAERALKKIREKEKSE